MTKETISLVTAPQNWRVIIIEPSGDHVQLDVIAFILNEKKKPIEAISIEGTHKIGIRDSEAVGVQSPNNKFHLGFWHKYERGGLEFSEFLSRVDTYKSMRASAK